MRGTRVFLSDPHLISPEARVGIALKRPSDRLTRADVQVHGQSQPKRVTGPPAGVEFCGATLPDVEFAVIKQSSVSQTSWLLLAHGTLLPVPFPIFRITRRLIGRQYSRTNVRSSAIGWDLQTRNPAAQKEERKKPNLVLGLRGTRPFERSRRRRERKQGYVSMHGRWKTDSLPRPPHLHGMGRYLTEKPVLSSTRPTVPAR